MFIRYFVELPLPAATVEEALAAPSAPWLEALASRAGDRGEGMLTEVGLGPRRLARPVRIRLGSPVRLASTTTVPMTWEPVGGEGLLPRLDADLEVGGLGPGRTQLAISARYRPPLGPLGEAVDRVVLHRVAEATVKHFLDRIGESIQAGAERVTAAPA
jgi:hypothetical protein